MSQLVNVRLPNWVAFAVRRTRLRFFDNVIVNVESYSIWMTGVTDP